MDARFFGKTDPDRLSPLTLAFVGDGVFDLWVREALVSGGNRPVKELNEQKVAVVCCQAQAALAEKIQPLLTEREADLYRRARNAHVGHCPKNASPAEYHAATAVEALVGWLCLEGDLPRISELLSGILSDLSEP